MTDTDERLEAIARAAEALLPALTERLSRHGLGEIEVTTGELRLRVTGSPAASSAHPEPASSAPELQPGLASTDSHPASSAVEVPSPAVGFFVYADGLGPGLEVVKGDALGHVEMLGVRHDVRAPRRGVVRHLVAESGEPVEYGQVVVEIETAEASR